MSATSFAAETAANPLDIVEQLVAANEWAFDRRTESALRELPVDEDRAKTLRQLRARRELRQTLSDRGSRAARKDGRRERDRDKQGSHDDQRSAPFVARRLAVRAAGSQKDWRARAVAR